MSEATLSAWREKMARAIYELDPFYESGEYVEQWQVSPGGYLSWDQACQRDAEFGDDPIFLKITAPAYKSADAALSAILPDILERAEQAIRRADSLDENGYICEKSKVIASIRSLASSYNEEKKDG